jgi:alpha-tubulin suppressor-like RCC1 family protein
MRRYRGAEPLPRTRQAPRRWSATVLTLTVLVAAASLAVVAGPAPARADGNEKQGAPRDARAITGGLGHTCALFDSGDVGCWGYGPDGQLGVGNIDNRGFAPGQMGGALPLVDLGPGRTARALTAGAFHTCALLDTGQVTCWGYGAAGQLGHGDTTSIGDGPGEMGAALVPVDLGTGRTALAISAGNSHTCALLDTKQVKCWGRNAEGQLGLGSDTTRGNAPGQMGDNLPTVDLGVGRTARSISAGGFHTCAVLDTYELKCWGTGTFGQLGTGDGNDRGDEPGEMGAFLPPIDLGAGRTVRAVSAGNFHTCAVLDTHQVKCFGGNDDGELGLGSTLAQGDEPGEMGDALPTVDLGSGLAARGVTTGSDHTCVLLHTNQVKCWGMATQGQLGLGDAADRGVLPGQMGDALAAVDLGSGRSARAVSTGYTHTCAVLDDLRMKCWGLNSVGQLGLGDNVTRGDGPGEMGDALPFLDLPDTVGRGRLQPDLTVRVPGKPAVGNDVHNTTGTNQTRSTTVKKGRQRVVTVRLQNDGNDVDTFSVTGTKSTRRFAITYTFGSRNITKKVTRGTYVTPQVQPGAVLEIRVTVAPKKAAVKGSKVTAKVTATSRVGTTEMDAVRAVITRR